MIRIDSRNERSNASSWLGGSVATLAAILGMALFTATPAQADHEEDAFASHLGRVAASHFLLAGDLIFGHAPVVEVHHYEEPRYERRHRHHARCGHGKHYDNGRKHHWKHGRKHHWKHDRHARKHHGRHHARNDRRHRGHRGDYDRGHRGRVSRHDTHDVGRRGGRH